MYKQNQLMLEICIYEGIFLRRKLSWSQIISKCLFLREMTKERDGRRVFGDITNNTSTMV